MFCPKCGSELLPGSAFCSDCGSEIPEISNAVPESNKDNISSPQNSQSQFNQYSQDPFKQTHNIPNVHNNLQNNRNQMQNNMGIPMQNPNQIQNIGMQQMPYPNQINNMPMGSMPKYQNQLHVMPMGMPMQYPNQMPNMMGMQQMHNQPININIMHSPPKKKKKNKFLAAFFAFFFGGLGAHKFYLGKYGWGILYALCPFVSFIIALCVDSPEIWLTGILTPAFVSFIEGIMYIFMANEDFQKKY